MSRSCWCWVILLISLSAGCSFTESGQAVRTPVNAVEHALPDPSQLRDVLGLPVETDASTQTGGSDVLSDDDGASSPRDCGGVANAGDRVTYHGAPLRAVARGSWATPRGVDDRVNIVVAVVELDSPGSARSWYGKTAAQWGRCRGVTMTERTNAVSFIQNLDRLDDLDGTLTAGLSVATDNGLIAPVVNQRAIVAASRYLVDVEVFGTRRRSDVSGIDAGAVAHLTATRLS